MARKVTTTDIYDREGKFLFTQTLTSYSDDPEFDPTEDYAE